jgi:hypothetical protein
LLGEGRPRDVSRQSPAKVARKGKGRKIRFPVPYWHLKLFGPINITAPGESGHSLARQHEKSMNILTNLRTVACSMMRFSVIGGAVLCLAGCIEHSETTYRDVERVKVRFESERAGRLFYEALSKMPFHDRVESHTEVSIPVVFDNKCTVKTGENEKFNEAVRRCDANQDGVITEVEAEIFASQFH